MKNLILKIIRGSYPPISPKYSYDIRNLVSGLLKKRPEDRPALVNIMRKSFIKRSLVQVEELKRRVGDKRALGARGAVYIRQLRPSSLEQEQRRQVADDNDDVRVQGRQMKPILDMYDESKTTTIMLLLLIFFTL